MESVNEILPFLALDSRLDLKVLALQHILGLTGTKDGLELLKNVSSKLIDLLLDIMEKCKEEVLCKDASLSLINISANESKVVLDCEGLVNRLWNMIEDKDCFVSDPACMILSNLTIDKMNCQKVSDLLLSHTSMDRIIFVFCQEGYNSKGAKLHYLGPFLSNLSQLSEIRRRILDESGFVVQRLLPFTEYKESKVRRGGIIGTLKNCCFEEDFHEFLLGEHVSILPRLLLPLAGPTPDDLDPEDVEKLPLDLQYLDEDKKVEEDPDLRKMLLEAITQLCAKKAGRELIRSNCAYFILRQLHKNEGDKSVRLACENLVDILIKKEDEIKLDNYKDIQVPNEVLGELEDMDKEYLKE